MTGTREAKLRASIYRDARRQVAGLELKPAAQYAHTWEYLRARADWEHRVSNIYADAHRVAKAFGLAE